MQQTHSSRALVAHNSYESGRFEDTIKRKVLDEGSSAASHPLHLVIVDFSVKVSRMTSAWKSRYTRREQTWGYPTVVAACEAGSRDR